MFTLEEILNILVNYYGDDTDRGCYIDGRWFSIEAIINVLNKYR